MATSDKANAVSNHLFPPILEQILLLGCKTPILRYGRVSLLGVLIAHDTGYWCRRAWVWQGVMYNSAGLVWGVLKSYIFQPKCCSDVWWQMVQHTNPGAGWNLPIFDIFETFTCVFLEKEPLPKKNHHWEIENGLKAFYLFNGFFMRMFEHEAPPSKNPHLEKAWWKPICWLPHPKGPTVIKAVFPPIEASR